MTDTSALDALRSNLPEYSVSEISALLKRTVEQNFAYVRIRGEVSGFKRHSSGHCYLALKDDEAVLDAVIWRPTAQRLALKPEDGMEVICAGKLTTYPGRSKYQLVIESVELAGVGALLKLLEDRKKKLEAEGLFAESRKKKLPFLPHIIGVVTSPTGAVIRDILHRLEDRFPRHVVVWPVAVQGEGAAQQIAAAIEGFNALVPGGPVPRPDLLIVARGGGSLEDLMAFNEEIVVRAAAASAIPLISAVGHETDTTLIDFASDRRAPTPTAAAEMAVPVRSELIAEIDAKRMRLTRALSRGLAEQRTHLAGLARGLPDPASLIFQAAQRLDERTERLAHGLRQFLRVQALHLKASADRIGGAALAAQIAHQRERLAQLVPRLDSAKTRFIERQHGLIEGAGARLNAFYRALEQQLERGYAIVRAKGHVVTAAEQVAPGTALTIEFHDGTVVAKSEGEARTRKRKAGPADQGKLFGLALLLLLALGSRAEAGTLALDGTPTQGSLMRGMVDPGAAVTLDGKPLSVAPDGHFIFGFGRDAAATAALDVKFADGSRTQRDLAVAPRQWDVRRIDGLPEKLVTPDAATLDRIHRDSVEVDAALATSSGTLDFEQTLRWPVLGTITGIFGSQSILDGQPRAPHLGVDIAAPAGTPIKAAASGVVTLAERDLYLTGGTVIIDHGYGLSSTYVHLATLAVKRGDPVRQGETIGTLGMTGRATGPNLHWGVAWYQVRLDPQLAAGQMPEK
ncbi:MAG TPA: exodeoxyribonuclease VII large subunit [Stellaceae bacterium]|nr:exodeoxyribonuclease VII large subunit [Stellaceae bacterium]